MCDSSVIAFGIPKELSAKLTPRSWTKLASTVVYAVLTFYYILELIESMICCCLGINFQHFAALSWLEEVRKLISNEIFYAFSSIFDLLSPSPGGDIKMTL